MKPHEEEWAAVDCEIYVAIEDEEPYRMGEFFHQANGTKSPERARLAAQAPAMARMLKTIWENSGPMGAAGIERILRDAGVIP